MATTIPTRTHDWGAGRTENLVMKIRPDVKKYLKDTTQASHGTITAYVERLVLEDMERRGHTPTGDA